MSRLFYPKVESPSAANGGVVRDPKEIGMEVAEKVAKLIPAELLTGYTGLISTVLAVKYSTLHPWLFGASFLLCLALTPIYLRKMADSGKPKRNHIAVSTIAFPIWAYFISGHQVVPQWHDPAIALLLMLVFSLVSAAIPMNR